MDTSALVRAIQACGSQAHLASKIGRTQQHISWCLKNSRPVSGQDAIKIEHATGGQVTRAELRPDLFDTPAVAAE
jgi:DNA-binding transcriptional regulator YdaS (Cro superfamily)